MVGSVGVPHMHNVAHHAHRAARVGQDHADTRAQQGLELVTRLASGAEVWSHALVERVVTRNGRAIGVVGRILNREGGAAGDRLEVRARRVVLAAGAWHTPLLLQRSGVGHPRWVGRQMTLHPGFRVLARFARPVRGWQGALQSAYTDAYEREGITLMGLFVPTGVLGATDVAVYDDQVGVFQAMQAGQIDATVGIEQGTPGNPHVPGTGPQQAGNRLPPPGKLASSQRLIKPASTPATTHVPD